MSAVNFPMATALVRAAEQVELSPGDKIAVMPAGKEVRVALTLGGKRSEMTYNFAHWDYEEGPGSPGSFLESLKHRIWLAGGNGLVVGVAGKWRKWGRR